LSFVFDYSLSLCLFSSSLKEKLLVRLQVTATLGPSPWAYAREHWANQQQVLREKRLFKTHFDAKHDIILPRQARDKQMRKEHSKKDAFIFNSVNLNLYLLNMSASLYIQNIYELGDHQQQQLLLSALNFKNFKTPPPLCAVTKMHHFTKTGSGQNI